MTFRDYVDSRVANGEKKGAVINEIAAATGLTIQSLRMYYRGARVGLSSSATKIHNATKRKCSVKDLTERVGDVDEA